MNKKEMIEEMAELTTGCVNCRAFGECFSKCSNFISNRIRATILVREGYTKNKIPDGSVVLSREEKQEYESLVKLLIYDKPIKSRVYEFIKEIKEQVRKETAIKIAFDIESRLAYYKDEDTFTKTEILLEIKEILKENGVEV